MNAALVADSLTKAHNIDVEVFKGRVQLNGFVGSSAERTQAVALTRKVSGVNAVDNNSCSAARSAPPVNRPMTLLSRAK